MNPQKRRRSHTAHIKPAQKEDKKNSSNHIKHKIAEAIEEHSWQKHPGAG